MDSMEEEYPWIVGNDPAISHEYLIDSGSFGRVHKMRNTVTEEAPTSTDERQVFARKVLFSKRDALEEIGAIERLSSRGNHVNLVAILGHGRIPGFYFIDMEFCDGNLEDHIKGIYPQRFEAALNPIFATMGIGAVGKDATIWDIIEQVASGICFIHTCGEVHRDLKPRNVLFSAKDRAWKIADFGLTTEGSSVRERHTQEARGTACYRAPELLDPTPVFSNKVDIFGLGCILFELVTGGIKAFTSDWHVHEYKARHRLSLAFYGIEDCRKSNFEKDICEMLSVDRTDRPSAVNLRRRFAQKRWIAVGHECSERKDYLNAIEMYKMAIDEGDVDPVIWKELGHGYKGTGNYHEAVKAYEAAVNGGLAETKLLMELGGVHCAIGNHGKAIMCYQSALKNDSNNPYLLMQIGDAYLSNKQYKQAIQSFQKGLKKSGNNAMLLEKLSYAHYANRNPDKAFKMNPNLKVNTDAHFATSPPSATVETRESLERFEPNEFVVLSGYSTRPVPGSLRIDTQVPTLVVSGDNIRSATVGSSADASPGLFRRPHVRRIRSANPVFGPEWTPLSASPSTPAAISDSANVTTFHVSIKAKQQHNSRLNDIADIHSDRMITIGAKIAALESYSARHFDEMSVSYGDLVEVEEIYEDGWILGFKLERKVWEDSHRKVDIGDKGRPLDVYLEVDNRIPDFEARYSSLSYLFEISHFCLSDMWEEVGHKNRSLSLQQVPRSPALNLREADIEDLDSSCQNTPVECISTGAPGLFSIQ